MKKAEIQKLREKVKNDPNSTLFVALAEEYRKVGMYDEAISVLEEGLSRQPNYTSARVALGRIFFDKSMLDEARGEFEKVVEVIPDNLYARQRLADIYEEQGLLEKAREQVDAIIKLNPNVFDGERFRHDLGPKLINAGWAAIDASENELFEDAEEPDGDGNAETLNSSQALKSLDEDVGKTVAPDDTPADLHLQEKSPWLELDGAPSTGEEGRESLEADASGKASGPSGDGTGASGSHKDDQIATESLARLYIQQNHYDKALDVYERLLAKDPENKAILQELGDLKALMTLTGAKRVISGGDNKEKTIRRLNDYLEKIRSWGEG